jgi:transposase
MLQCKLCVYSPFCDIEGVRFRDIYKKDLPAGSEVAMTNSGYINEDIFLEWLQHFLKHRSPGKCLLILDGHASHSSLKCLDYCRDNGIEMLCLSPHKTQVLQPLDRTVFKPIKTYYHQAAKTLCTTILKLQSSNFILENFSPKLGTKEQQLAML